MHFGSRDITIYLVSVHGKNNQNLTNMPIIFYTVDQIKKKLHFWIALINTFRILLVSKRSEFFAIVFGNDVIMMSFVIVGLSN